MSEYSMSYMYRTVMDLYDSDKWRYKVRNMSDNQIIAIFFDSLERDSKKERPHYDNVCDAIVRVGEASVKAGAALGEAITKACTDDDTPEQLSFFD